MTVLEKINEILKTKGIDADKIDRDISVITSGIMDSLAFVNMLLEIEDKFGIEIDFANVELGNIATINGIINHAEELLKQTG